MAQMSQIDHFFFFFWNNRQAWLMALSDHVEDEYDSSWYGIILADPNL